MPLPRSALLSLWLQTTLRGSVGPDDFAVGVRSDDPQHLIVDWPGSPEPLPLESLPMAVLRLEDPVIRLALPAPGDPLGLAGPPSFNAGALEVREAALVTGTTSSYGLVPVLDARTVLWTCTPAEPAPLLDPGEASRTLRQVLVAATVELVRLDVAAWQPEIPDLLLNLKHRPDLTLPPDITPAAAETLERATLCLDIVALARRDDGGAISAHEIAARARCLTELDLAARRAIVAVCSDNLGTK